MCIVLSSQLISSVIHYPQSSSPSLPCHYFAFPFRSSCASSPSYLCEVENLGEDRRGAGGWGECVADGEGDEGCAVGVGGGAGLDDVAKFTPDTNGRRYIDLT